MKTFWIGIGVMSALFAICPVPMQGQEASGSDRNLADSKQTSPALEKDYRTYQEVIRKRGTSSPFFRANALSRYNDWLEEAMKGNAIAEFFVSRCYQEGIVVPQDDGLTLKWVTLSANHGNTFAMVNLGICYDNGRGVTKNHIEAMRWYRKAADLAACRREG